MVSLPWIGKVSAKLTDGMTNGCLLMCLKCSFIVSNINLPPTAARSPPFKGGFSFSATSPPFLLTDGVICPGKLLAVSLICAMYRTLRMYLFSHFLQVPA